MTGNFFIIMGFIVFVLLAIELGLHFLLLRLGNKYDLILTGKDKIPKLNRKKLEKFFKTGYDPELGWVRKPNTSKTEISVVGKKSYHINSMSSRTNPGHEHLKTKIISFGDSYTFNREVNDNETWQYYLANLIKGNVGNFGVGNYGLDQAFLRFKRELPNYKDAKLVVIGVVPDTISRNLTVWKHYSEFGNTFGFKPRFMLNKGKLKLIPNILDKKEKFFELKKIIPQINKYDYFYRSFKENLFTFPYTISIVKDPKKKISLLFFYSIKYFFELFSINWRKIKFIPSSNIKKKVYNFIVENRIKGYNDKEISSLTILILKEFSKIVKKKKISVIFILMPQKEDIEYILETKNIYYKKFIERVKRFMPYIDLTEKFIQLKDPFSIFPRKTYSENYTVYGGHYNAKGNKIIAEEINKFIKTKLKG